METAQSEAAPRLKPDVKSRLQLLAIQEFTLGLAGVTKTIGYEYREGWHDPIVRFFKGWRQIAWWNVSTGRGGELRISDDGRSAELPFMGKNASIVIGRIVKTARKLPKYEELEEQQPMGKFSQADQHEDTRGARQPAGTWTRTDPRQGA